MQNYANYEKLHKPGPARPGGRPGPIIVTALRLSKLRRQLDSKKGSRIRLLSIVGKSRASW